MWTKTVERRIPPPKQRTKPIRQTKDFKKWKIKWKDKYKAFNFTGMERTKKGYPWWPCKEL
jgi:hypothetical protein